MIVDAVLKTWEKEAELSHTYGGTAASANLRLLLSLRKRMDALIVKWRRALEVHNAQPVKVHEYDLETGEIKSDR